MTNIKYNTRTFYVPADKLETLIKFQNKCKENGHKSYSEVILKLMENYNNG
jgi:predicted CopG family antitoxin